MSDIFDALQGLNARLNSMQGTIDSQHAQICSLTRNAQHLNKENANLRKENESLKKENEELRKRLGDDPKDGCGVTKDSTNSSTPPSQDPIPKQVERRTKSLREKTGRHTGGQEGHPGTTLLRDDRFDEEVVHAPAVCEKCGAPIGGDAEIIEEYEEDEIDIVVKAIKRRHKHCSAVCPCGHRTPVEKPRARGGNAVQYGKLVRSLVLYLGITQLLPLGRLQQTLREVFGVSMSQGTIQNIIDASKDKAEPLYAMIRNEVAKRQVVGFDESGCYCHSRLDWSWIANTDDLTYVFRASGRDAAVLEERFGNNIEHMTAVTDRHSSYFKLNFKSHQVCLAHLLRNLKYLDDIDKGQTWSQRIGALFRKAIHVRNQNPLAVFETSEWLEKLDEILKENIEKLGKDFVRMKNGLFKCRDYLFNFLADPSIPSHNNGSERGFRKLKLKQKISGTFRTEKGADTFFVLHSIVDTNRKNNMPVFQQLHSFV